MDPGAEFRLGMFSMLNSSTVLMVMLGILGYFGKSVILEVGSSSIVKTQSVMVVILSILKRFPEFGHFSFLLLVQVPHH